MGDKDTKLAVIAIVVEKEEGVRELNELLHGCSGYIIGRMGIPYREKGVSVLSVVIDAPAEIINTLTGKIGMLEGVTAKTLMSKF